MRYYADLRYCNDTCKFSPTDVKIKEALLYCGAVNIRTSYKFGWNNQPKVYTFSLVNDGFPDDEFADKFDKIITESLGDVGIYTKDW